MKFLRERPAESGGCPLGKGELLCVNWFGNVEIGALLWCVPLFYFRYNSCGW